MVRITQEVPIGTKFTKYLFDKIADLQISQRVINSELSVRRQIQQAIYVSKARQITGRD